MFPASIDDYLPENYLAGFVVEIVEHLDLRCPVEACSGRDSSAYHPVMMVGLLFYGYAAGKKPAGREPRGSEEGSEDRDRVNLVDGESRFIVTRNITRNTNDKRGIESAFEQLTENREGLGETVAAAEDI